MTREKPMQQVGRLALRQEGNSWNAYYAQNHTMEGAIYLGTLSMQFAVVPKHKQAFMDLMRDVVSDILEGATGIRPEWKEPHAAPESERSGNA